MPSIAWDTESIEPDPRGRRAAQLSVEVVGADSSWAQRFNDLAFRQRDEVRGGRWGDVTFHVVEGLITVDDLYEGSEKALRRHLAQLLGDAGS